MSELTLKRNSIIKSRKRIVEILQKGKRFHSEFLSVYYLPSEKMAFAVLIKKKIGKPHRRNKVKRWVRESYRCNVSSLTDPIDLICLAHHPCSDAGYSAVHNDLCGLLEKIKSA